MHLLNGQLSFHHTLDLRCQILVQQILLIFKPVSNLQQLLLQINVVLLQLLVSFRQSLILGLPLLSIRAGGGGGGGTRDNVPIGSGEGGTGVLIIRVPN